MKCHYEVLGVPRTAEDDEIKKAYRKLALRWHPDKNLDNAEEANQQFLLVQAAYDVLSDMQERAWYDNHREQILRGGHTNYEDNSVDLFQYFTTSCYKGFGDDPGGFYAVYAEVFHTIASEEIEFLDDEDDFEAIPKFGNSQSDYESEVRLFYGYWEGFCTKKSYAWLNPHNIAEIRDRRILKAIERDNKKVQQKARKERNEEIRSLVLFVKKRDKRVQAYKKLLEERAEQNRLKSAQNRLEQIRRKQKEIEEQQRNSSNVFNEAYEEQLRKLEASYADTSDDSSDDVTTGDDPGIQAMGDAMNGLIISQDENGEESFYVDDLYCVACDKMFNNKKSYENHESSRKHKQNVELLREQMRKDDDLANGTGGEKAVEVEEVDVGSELSEEEEEEVVKVKSKKGKNKKKPVKKVSSEDEEEEPVLDIPMPGTSKGVDSDDDWGGSKKGKKGKGKSKDAGSGKAKVTKEEPAKEPPAPVVEPAKEETESAESVDHKCVTCNEKFGSKNKLFNHLKQTGHSVYVDKLKATQKGDGEKPKGGKKRK